MNADKSQRLLQHIRRLAGDPPGTPSDGELLRRFVDVRDEAAFAALVRRHGAMVFSVCQSVLRQRHDAEDASQATFLILARKAGSIRRQDGLGGWLQRVAYRVALKARTDNIRRQEREAKAACASLAEPAGDELSWSEMRSILHAELAALPEQFRAPLVLCYLEGLTQEEAAHRLGWTAATVKGRLQRGREKLRRRLEHRGVALAAALAAALTGQTLAETAVRSGGLLTMGTATTAAAALAQGFLRPLLTMKLAVLSVALLSIGVVAGGMALRSPPSEPRPSDSENRQNRSLKVADREEAEPRAAVDAHGDPLPDGAVARLGTIRFNHGKGLNALYFTPDGKTLLSEGNGSIRFWDADSGKDLGRMSTVEARYPYHQTALFADGQTFLSLYWEEEEGDVVHIWNVAQKKEIRRLKLPVKRRVNSIDHQNALSPDGKRVLLHVDTPAQAQVFDLATGKNLYQLAGGAKEFLAVAFAGKDRIVSADAKQRIEVWEAQSGKLVRQFTHRTPIRYLLSSPDGRWLAGLEQYPSPYGQPPVKDVNLWEARSGTLIQTLPIPAGHWITNLRFAPDGKSLLVSSRNWWDFEPVVLWDCQTGRRLRVFDKTSAIDAGVAAISPDGSRLAAGDPAGKFELWNLKNGHRLTSEDSRYTQATDVILAPTVSVFLSPTGERATVIGQKFRSYWDAISGRRLQAFDLPPEMVFLNFRARSSDGRYAVSYQTENRDLNILLWDLPTGKCLHTLRVPDGHRQLNSVCSDFSADSSLLATWHGEKDATIIRIWDVKTGKEVRSFAAKKDSWPARMFFSADAQTLLVAGQHVVGYEVASGKERFLWQMPPMPSNIPREHLTPWRVLAFSPHDSVIAAILFEAPSQSKPKGGRIVLYDAATGKVLRRCDDSGQRCSRPEQLAFSPSGAFLASSDGNLIHLWEAATGKEIRAFRGHRHQIASLAFSDDDHRLASASWDSTILIWDVTNQPAKATVLNEAKLRECWNDLAAEDAGRANRAVWTLIRAPRESVPFLKAHLHPPKPVRREQIDRWIQALDADVFAVRQKAAAELEKLGERAEPALRRALENKPTLEQRRRMEPILAKLETAIPSGEALRSLRAVRVLTHIDTAEAQQLLREITNGRR